MSKKFYFNTDNDDCDLDPNGTEFDSVDQARPESIALAGELLMNGSGDVLLRGRSLKVWVTDGAGGSGRTLFSIQVSASDGDPESYKS